IRRISQGPYFFHALREILNARFSKEKTILLWIRIRHPVKVFLILSDDSSYILSEPVGESIQDRHLSFIIKRPYCSCCQGSLFQKTLYIIHAGSGFCSSLRI